MVSQSNIVNNGVQIALRSGPNAIDVGDLLEIGGPGNTACAVETINYAAIAAAGPVETGATLTIRALTSASNFERQAVATDPLGRIFTLGTTGSGSATGLGVARVDPDANNPTNAVLDATANVMASAYILKMKNGTFAAVYKDTTSFQAKYVMFDTGLHVLAGPTNIAATYNVAAAFLGACELAGGGFGVAFQNGSKQIDLTTFDDFGVQTLVPTNVKTFTSGPDSVEVRIGQLSDGHLVIPYYTVGQTPAGGGFVITDLAGVNVAGPVVHSAATGGTFPGRHLLLSIIPGFFCLAQLVGTAGSPKIGVYSNAGVLQNAVYTGGGTPAFDSAYLASDLVTDGGGTFWLLTGSSTNLLTVKMTTAGVGSNQTLVPASGFANDHALSAAFMDNVIVVMSTFADPAGSAVYLVLGLPDPTTGAGQLYFFTNATAMAIDTSPTLWPHVIGGDWTPIFAWDNSDASGHIFFAIIKISASAIVGVSLSNVAAGNPGTPVVINEGAGGQPCNHMAGTSGTAFDNSVTTPVGNKGKIFSDGVTLVGM